MFTGLIEAAGVVRSITRKGGGAVLTIERPALFTDLVIGDSVAIDGVCLTVVELTSNRFGADVSEETLSRSTLAKLRVGARVNLERAMSASSRFGGHMVSGHVDAMVELLSKTPAGGSTLYEFAIPEGYERLIVDKGSVALAGISLTVMNLTAKSFSVAVIPHTERETTLGSLALHDEVNFEADVIGKYVIRMLDPHLGSIPHTFEDPSDRLRDLLAGY